MPASRPPWPTWADDQNFAEGYELGPETAKKIPKEAIGRRLSQEEAAELLDHLAA